MINQPSCNPWHIVIRIVRDGFTHNINQFMFCCLLYEAMTNLLIHLLKDMATYIDLVKVTISAYITTCIISIQRTKRKCILRYQSIIKKEKSRK